MLNRLVGLLWLLFTGLFFGQAHADTPAPNILVLMAEDLSARIGAFGDPLARTPNIDELASQGVRFPNTFTAAGVCAPSRAAFITGVHQITLGAQHMRSSDDNVMRYLAVPPAEVKAFPELLRRAGYYTFTDRKLDYQFSGIGAGTGPSTIWDAQGLGNHLENVPTDRPFFGLINFLITHESAAFTPDSVTSDNGRAVAKRAAAARSRLAHRTPPAEVVVPPYYPDLPEVREHIADLYDNVQLMDAQVGQVIETLKAGGHLEDTIVIWTTDHGDPLPRAKRELHDSGIRVPMIIRWPDAYRPAQFTPGMLDERLISFVDLASVIMDMAGLPAPGFQHGRNILDPATDPRRYIYASRDRMDEFPDRIRAVRDDRFKYLRYFQPDIPGANHLAYRDQGRVMQALWRLLAAGELNETQSLWFEPRPDEALYDLSSDPDEIRNLADDPAHLATLTRMRSAYGAWRLRVPDRSDQPEIEMAEHFWPGGQQPTSPMPMVEIGSDGMVAIDAAEQASIEYRIDAGPWSLYSAPFKLPEGSRVSARSIRYGYAESAEVSAADSAL